MISEGDRFQRTEILKWREHSKSTRERSGVSLTGRPWSSRPGKQMYGIPQGEGGERKRDCIDVAVLITMKEAGVPADDHHGMDRVTKQLKVDVSQSVHRHPFSSDGLVDTLTTRSEVYLCEYDRIVLGHEALALNGWCFDPHVLRGLSERALWRLSANSMAGPSIGSALACAILGASCGVDGLARSG